MEVYELSSDLEAIHSSRRVSQNRLLSFGVGDVLYLILEEHQALYPFFFQYILHIPLGPNCLY